MTSRGRQRPVWAGASATGGAKGGGSRGGDSECNAESIAAPRTGGASQVPGPTSTDPFAVEGSLSATSSPGKSARKSTGADTGATAVVVERTGGDKFRQAGDAGAGTDASAFGLGGALAGGSTMFGGRGFFDGAFDGEIGVSTRGGSGGFSITGGVGSANSASSTCTKSLTDPVTPATGLSGRAASFGFGTSATGVSPSSCTSKAVRHSGFGQRMRLPSRPSSTW